MGKLKSYRSLEDQLAKLFGNIGRLEAAGDKEEELASRKAQAAKLRAKGVVPTPGVCVFSQLDTDKNRKLSKPELGACLEKLAPDANLDSWFGKLLPPGGDEVTEEEWLQNLCKVP